jgi:hypothetical protein
MADWTGTTTLSVAEIAAAARDGASSEFNAVQRRVNKFGWRAIPDADGGVLEQSGAAPAWSGRATWQHGGAAAYCDVEVYDRGDRRDVVLTRGHKLGAGGASKRLMNGIAQAISRAP